MAGDEGGKLGKAFGKGGAKRLDFALAEFDRVLKKPLANANNPVNSIHEINIAIFGFSRGAALARVFARGTAWSGARVSSTQTNSRVEAESLRLADTDSVGDRRGRVDDRRW